MTVFVNKRLPSSAMVLYGIIQLASHGHRVRQNRHQIVWSLPITSGGWSLIPDSSDLYFNQDITLPR